jgi:aspartate carbamoyltransferase catalytic subunit
MLKRQVTYHSVPHHLISIKGLSMEFVQLLLCTAEDMKHMVKRTGGDDRLRYKVLASVFYEPSTRTSSSFQSAMLRLGGSVICINEEQSSIRKGESLEDTIQTMSCYCDVIVLRHPVKGSAAAASIVSSKPVINAGDGTGEHPTQALLDLYTIQSELKRIGGKSENEKQVITLLGDLKNGYIYVIILRLIIKIIFIHLFYYIFKPNSPLFGNAIIYVQKHKIALHFTSWFRNANRHNRSLNSVRC